MKTAFIMSLFLGFLSQAQEEMPTCPSSDATSSIVNFHTVNENGSLFRGGRPGEAGIELLARCYHVKHIVNLQGGDKGLFRIFEDGESKEDRQEEADQATQNGIKAVNFPLTSWKKVDAQQASLIQGAVDALNTSSPSEPTYVHCAHGKDRTGLVVALYRVQYQNWSPAKAHQEMLDMGHTGKLDFLVTCEMDEYFYVKTNWKPDNYVPCHADPDQDQAGLFPSDD